MAALASAGVAAGLAVVVPMPLAVQATVPTPGVITTFAGGGLGLISHDIGDIHPANLSCRSWRGVSP